ncbi:MAG: ShlB/FhaC/HecB family hemolysin secretion/activation protein [Sulfuritalea sp.]|jgi:hemolysin activation/secretion protein|nr:ShlB/FhaC/HecB family hemolysin secretion/activation protein [Sulfuritalea sp.]
MLKKNLYTLALLAASQSAFAVDLLNAGSQMQQIPPAPLPQKATPTIPAAPRTAPASPESSDVKIVVKSLNVTGAQVYSEAELLALTGFTPGSELSLADLRGMAAKIASHYRSHGYFVAQAYLPAQDIKNGAVTIAVIEGHYGKVQLNNQTNLSDGLATGLLGGLNEGDLVQSEPLENRLLLLSDVPGVNVKSTLVPGASVGASDLIVDLTPAPRVSGEVDFDNAGNRYTGEYRLGGTVNLNNLAGHGDIASLRGMTAGSGLNYARAAYQMQFGKATAGVSYSALEYKLGKEFEPLRAHGTAEIASIYGSYPLIRSRNNNVNVGLAYEDKTFQDKEDVTPSVTDKKAQVLMGSLYGNHRDGFGGGGLTAYSLTWSTGELDIETPAARTIDAATAKTNGHYDKLGFTGMRLQSVTPRLALYAGLNAQFASKNLDSSEKMELGGMYGVRAYPEGEAYADEGYVLNLEARYQLVRFFENLRGQLQLIGFVDTGSVTTHRNPWVDGPNSRTLSGAGVGLNWSETNNFMARAYYAVKVGNEKATSAPDKSGRFWIQLVKYF